MESSSRLWYRMFLGIVGTPDSPSLVTVIEINRWFTVLQHLDVLDVSSISNPGLHDCLLWICYQAALGTLPGP